MEERAENGGRAGGSGGSSEEAREQEPEDSADVEPDNRGSRTGTARRRRRRNENAMMEYGENPVENMKNLEINTATPTDPATETDEEED